MPWRSEAIHIFREVAGEFERPVILFSGGKDSTVLLHLAIKAFWPAALPFPLLHVDTGHNFPEVLAFRDQVVEKYGLRLHVASVEDYIADGRLTERPDGIRNPLQTVPLLDAIAENRFDAVFGGAAATRSGPAPRSGSSPCATRSASGIRERQRPELWNLYNGRHAPGEHVRVFPLSNWTELDIWRYIAREDVELAEHLLRAPARRLPARRHVDDPRCLGRPEGRRRAARRAVGALPHRRRRLHHRRGPLRRRRRRRRSSPRSRQPR